MAQWPLNYVLEMVGNEHVHLFNILLQQLCKETEKYHQKKVSQNSQSKTRNQSILNMKECLLLNHIYTYWNLNSTNLKADLSYGNLCYNGVSTECGAAHKVVQRFSFACTASCTIRHCALTLKYKLIIQSIPAWKTSATVNLMDMTSLEVCLRTTWVARIFPQRFVLGDCRTCSPHTGVCTKGSHGLLKLMRFTLNIWKEISTWIPTLTVQIIAWTYNINSGKLYLSSRLLN